MHRAEICTNFATANGKQNATQRATDEPGSDKNIDILLPRQAAKVVLEYRDIQSKVSPVNTEKTIEGILNRQQSEEDIY